MDYLYLGGAAFSVLLTLVVVGDMQRRRRIARRLSTELAHLRETEERYKELIEHATDIICRTDARGRFTFVNPTLARLLGRPEATLLNAFAREFVRPDWVDRAAAFYRQQISAGATHAYFELPLAAANGDDLWAGLNIQTILENGAVAGFNVIARDVTGQRRAEDALRQNEELYRKLCESSPMGIWHVDEPGYTIYINPAMCRLLEIEAPTDLEGFTYHDGFFTPESYRTVASEQEKRHGGVSSSYEVEMITRRGNRRKVIISGSAIFRSDGSLASTIGTFTDITDRKHIEEALRTSEQRFRELFDQAPVAYHEIDRQGIIQRVNRAELNLLGYTAEDMLGRPVWQFVSPEYRQQSYEWVRRKIVGVQRIELFEREYVCKDGSPIALEIHENPITDEDGRIVGFRTALLDITGRKAAEEAARRVQDYAQRLREKNDELASALEAAHEATQTKSRFLASMSHELRTPLNGIIGFSELMLDGVVGPVSAEHKDFLDDILDSARHLLALINDILDLSKIESGKMDFRPEPVDPVRLIGEVRDVLRPLTEKKQLSVTVPEVSPVGHVMIDPGRFKQVLYNYISNAIKFTPSGGFISVRLSDEDALDFRVEVEDSGVGIAASDLPKLFLEFEQLTTSRAKNQGTGLGLALTKALVTAQHGRVGVESVPGRGSVFYAVLPKVAAERATLPVHSAPIAQDTAAPVVLVVEDNPQEAKWLQSILEDAGYRVEVARSGITAIARCREHRFDAITLDLVIDGENGWDVLHALRSMGLNQRTPVIVVSVCADREAGAGFPIQDFLTKPVDPADLLAALENAGVPPCGKNRVLVVDDDPGILKLMKATLANLGYEPVCCPDAPSALHVAAATAPAAIILDLMMPEMDGFEFLERFRSDRSGARTPVIVWTNKDLGRDEFERLKGQAEAVVLKMQGSPKNLLDRLQSVVPAHKTPLTTVAGSGAGEVAQ